MTGGHAVAEARTPDGRRVVMDTVAWNHVLDEHVELDDLLEIVIAVIEAPDHREDDPRPGRERFYRQGGPHGWIRVVVEFAGDHDRIVTAFPQSNDPRIGGWQR